MFVHVSEARYVEAYRIWLRFEDGLEGIVDLRDELTGPVFEPLRDEEVFRAFSVDKTAKTIVWPNGADLAPEFLRSRVA